MVKFLRVILSFLFILSFFILLLFRHSSSSEKINFFDDAVVTALAVQPTNPARILVGTQDKGLFITKDSGSSWHGISDSVHINFVRFDGSNPTIVYSGTSGGDLLKSTGGGEKFQIIRKGSGEFNSLNIDGSPQNFLYAGSTKGIYKSVDGGKTWMPSGLPNLNVLSTSIDNKEKKPVVYASAMDAGIFRSTTSGLTWGNCGEGLGNNNVTSILIDRKIPYLLFAGTLESGLFKSTNNGDSWAPCIKGLATLSWISLVQTVDAKAMRTIQYAAGHENLVFKSNDLGENWTLLDSVPTGVSIYCLAIADVFPAPLWAGTNKGLFKILETQEADTSKSVKKASGEKGK